MINLTNEDLLLLKEYESSEKELEKDLYIITIKYMSKNIPLSLICNVLVSNTVATITAGIKQGYIHNDENDSIKKLIHNQVDYTWDIAMNSDKKNKEEDKKEK